MRRPARKGLVRTVGAWARPLVLAGLLGLPATMALALPYLQGERPARLLQQVETRAAQTSFADLDRFGTEAERLRTTEGLRRLHHVVSLYINQNEGPKARAWNARLMARATALDNERFRAIAGLNNAILAYEGGDGGAADRIHATMNGTSDWYVRAVATRYYAITRFDKDQVGEGLRLLTAVQAQIPNEGPDADIAHSGIWEIMGLGLMALNDVQGATDAFARYELDYSPNDWPRPDFDSIYNLGSMAIQVGDAANAERFFAAHDRLARRSNLHGLKAYNAMMCARVASMRDDMPRVLSCMEAGQPELSRNDYLKVWILPLEVIALARTGRVAEAERVMADWDAVADSETGRLASDLGVRARAELLHAQGQYDEAIALMRRYQQQSYVSQARAYSDGIHQITQDMQEQLSQRRRQLEVEQANARLQSAMIRAQAWVMGISLFFFVCGFATAAWLWIQSRALRRARRRAEQANMAKTQFLANMSHEIRTPLNGVVAMADVLHRSDLQPKDRDLVDIIRSSAGTLERLLNDILDSARIESGRLRLESAPFNVCEILEGVQQLWSASAEDKGIKLELLGCPELDRTVTGDAERLRQVLNNLVSNAVKFTEAGTVTIKAEPLDGDRIRFSVTDTGVGFEEGFRQRLFGRFQQADESITRRYGGSGLGLNISQNLIALMGGDMNCESQLGKGSRFWFDIALTPVGKVATETGNARKSTMPDHEACVTKGSGLKVLLADDHAPNRKVVEVLLGPLDVELTAVVDGQQAVEAFEKGCFDLVLMDMQMPVMDGLTATQRLRQIERRDGRVHTPIIMLTANAMSEHVEATMAAGADRHLTKPLTAQSLIGCIASVLEDTA
ncbi:ATP-binding protein [Brevundimonas terrae]|nr:ATP-binding protein [Brevundimonas terrae]NIJ27943.1 signal transduction histidine kinase/ActR/RegA family two-component response regulator [Brevundimonas terrae]